jgi:hypothetical protein
MKLNTDIRHIPLAVDRFVLTQEYRFKFLHKGKIKLVVIPKGFEWDGASVPRVAWSLLGFYPGGIMLAPSLPHDWGYIKKGRLTDKFTGDFTMTRKELDDLFLAHMLEVGMPPKKAKRAYFFVRLLGGLVWNGIIRL